MWKVYFFGAGKRGRDWAAYFKEFGAVPEGFIDNKQMLWGSSYEGIPIYAPNQLKMQKFDYVAITCNDEETICQQLLRMGIEESKILFGYKLRNYLLYIVSWNVKPKNFAIPKVTVIAKPKVFFDLQNGMTLGGVEAWSYEVAGQIKNQGFEGAYLMPDNIQKSFADTKYPAHILQYRECKKETERITLSARVIAENLPCTVICNFPSYIFWSACMVKKIYPDEVRIIAVQHSDDTTYYEAYSLWQEYVDQYLIISSAIGDKLTAYGVDRNKMLSVGWRVSCDKILDRAWSRGGSPIQIGYAGRVTTAQKRADLLLETALKLRKNGILFSMNIAGTGNFAEMLDRSAQEEGLCEYINMIGYVERKKIPDFWKVQDIMLSCSEREGHSITQSEAMAAGAVPVITDVSGARDDVTDGYNGYIVPVGDIDALVERISRLYYSRNELKLMGERAHDTIYERQRHMDQSLFWNDLLRKVWQ